MYDKSFVEIAIKIPIEIGNYEIPSNIDTAIKFPESNKYGFLYIEANEGCFSVKCIKVTKSSSCGWFTLRYLFEITEELITGRTGICNMEYSFCFDSIQLIDRNVKCNVQHNFKYNCDISACVLGGGRSIENYFFPYITDTYPIAFSK